MSKKEKRPAGVQKLDALAEIGDQRAAGVEARRILADAGASEAEKDAARAALVRIKPDRMLLLVFAVGVALALFVVYFTLLRR